jgi:hypothetical protein
VGIMVEHVPYVETLLREYLLFRGFTATLASFNSDRTADRTHGCDVDKAGPGRCTSESVVCCSSLRHKGAV